MNKETSIHLQIAVWLNSLDILWWHTPNGGRRDAAEARLLRRMGVRAGVPDLFLVRPDGVHIAAEVKAPGGKVSHQQQYFLTKLREVGWQTGVVESLEDMQLLYLAKADDDQASL